MTITFTIPNQFAAVSGQAQLEDLDDNFDSVQVALSGLVAAMSDLPLSVNATGTRAWGKGADISDAAAITLGSDGNYFVCNGTTTVTSISSKQAGCVILLRFAGIRTLTHNATSLILMGATNATTAVGDLYWFISEGGGNWREIWRRPVTNATSAFVFLGNGTFGTVGASSLMIGEQSTATVADDTARFVPPSGQTFSPSTSTTIYAIPVARAGTARNLFVKLTTAPGAGEDATLTVYKNGVATNLSVVINGTNTAGSDTSDTVSFAQGDTMMVGQILTSGGATSADNKWSFEFA